MVRELWLCIARCDNGLDWEMWQKDRKEVIKFMSYYLQHKNSQSFVNDHMKKSYQGRINQNESNDGDDFALVAPCRKLCIYF